MNIDKQNRRQLAKQISQTLSPMGVFQIRNKMNGKLLVGSSMTLDKVWNRHYFQLNMNAHPNKELSKEWKEYGEEAFVLEVLEELKPKDEICTDPAELKAYKKDIEALEELWVEKLAPFGEQGYHKPPRA